MLALRVILALGAVVGVLWFVQKRVAGHQIRTRAGDPLTVVARRGISPKASVVVIDTGGQRLVLGVTEQSVSVLHAGEAPPAPEPALEPALPTVRPAEAFAAALSKVAGTGKPEAAAGPLRHADLAPSPLAGSLFAPETWKQAAEALRKGPIR